MESAAHVLAAITTEIEKTPDLDSLRGREGDAARTYFNVFDHLITAQKQTFIFSSRRPAPPLDPVNAILSFLYAMLGHDAPRHVKPPASIPRSAFCTAIAPAGRVSRWTSWKNFVLSSPIDSLFR